jgi:hypothetical protein
MWGAFSLLPSEVSVVLKEQIAFESVKNMQTILKNICKNEKARTG